MTANEIRSRLRELAGKGGIGLDDFADPPPARPLRIGVIGIFSTGKSSFLNVLLGRVLLPTHVGPKTAVPVLIERTSGPEQAELEYKNGTIEVRGLDAAISEGALPSGTDPDEVERFAASGKIKSISLRLHLPDEFTDVQLIDTPGLNSPYEEHERLASGVLRGSDVVLYLLDEVLKDADRSALIIGKKHVSRFIFLQTKVDRPRLQGSWDETIAANAAEISKVVGKTVTVLPVSVAKTRATDGAEPPEWGMPRVREVLSAAISDRHRLRAHGEALRLQTAVKDAVARAAARSAALAGDDPELRASLEACQERIVLARRISSRLDPLLATAVRDVEAFSSKKVSGWLEELRAAMLPARIGGDPQEHVRRVALDRVHAIIDREASPEVERAVAIADASARDVLYDAFDIDVSGPLRGHPALEIECPPVPRGLLRRLFDWISGEQRVNENEVERIAGQLAADLSNQLGKAVRSSLADAFGAYMSYVNAEIPTLETNRAALHDQLEGSRSMREARLTETREIEAAVRRLESEADDLVGRLQSGVGTA